MGHFELFKVARFLEIPLLYTGVISNKVLFL